MMETKCMKINWTLSKWFSTEQREKRERGKSKRNGKKAKLYINGEKLEPVDELMHFCKMFTKMVKWMARF